jgi:hypothetical protein
MEQVLKYIEAEIHFDFIIIKIRVLKKGVRREGGPNNESSL